LAETVRLFAWWCRVTKRERGVFTYHAVAGDSKPLRFFVRGRKLNYRPGAGHVHFVWHRDDNYPVYLSHGPIRSRRSFAPAYGSQISLSIGIVGILLSFSFGMMIGGISGYFGGRTTRSSCGCAN